MQKIPIYQFPGDVIGLAPRHCE